MPDLRSPIAKARDEWLESDEGKGAANEKSLRMADDPVYLRNRLDRAFTAGWNAAERHLSKPKQTK